METNFEEIKTEILRRAKDASACKEQYRRAALAEDMDQLCAVIKDNFWWACEKEVLSIDLLKQYEVAFAEHDIYVNVSVERGFLLCDSATVRASGNASVVGIQQRILFKLWSYRMQNLRQRTLSCKVNQYHLLRKRRFKVHKAMRKKYRKAVYFSIIGIICLMSSPILLMGGMGLIAGWVCEKLLTPMVERLKTRLRVYDYDPD